MQAENTYIDRGQQAVRRLYGASPGVVHSVFGPDGNRIAEYDEGSGALLREYVWLDGVPVAVREGGVNYFVRVDHIGRPVFATNAAGTKVWTATYLPFGGVQTSTGTPITLRFPGQWFQSENGLHQNWMRDYDPTTGRYLQADPQGLVDGASVYGYVGQNPGRWVDPRGEDTVWGGNGPISVPVPMWPGETRPGQLGQSMLELSHRYNPIDLLVQKIVEECKSCPPCSPYPNQTIGYRRHSGHRSEERRVGKECA